MAKLRKQPRSPSAVAGHHTICCCVWYLDDSIVCLNELKKHETERALLVWLVMIGIKRIVARKALIYPRRSNAGISFSLPWSPWSKRRELDSQSAQKLISSFSIFKSAQLQRRCFMRSLHMWKHISFYMFTHWFTPSPSVTQIRENTIEYNFQPLCFARSDAHSSHRHT